MEIALASCRPDSCRSAAFINDAARGIIAQKGTRAGLMTKLICMAPRTRSGFPRFAAGAVFALGVTLMAPASAFAKAQIEGGRDAVRIEAQDTSVEEILAALGDAFDLRYRSSANLGRKVSGTYRGSLERVVRRVLEGYDFVLKTDNGRLEVTVLGPRTPAAAVAAASPAIVQPAASSAPAIAQPAASSAPAPASVSGNASGSPAAPVPRIASATAIKAAEGLAALFSAAGAEPSKMPGVEPAAPLPLSKIPGMRPGPESPGTHPRL